MLSRGFFVLALVIGTNAYLGKDLKSTNPKDINQWNIIQVVPTNGQSNSQQASSPSSVAPGFVWIQVPASNFLGSSPSTESKLPNNGNIQPLVQPVTEKSPGSDLNKLCLKPRGQFPSKICNKFVNCWDGTATEQECPPGLLFSSKGYCDYPENVNCNGKPVEGPTPSIPVDSAVTSSSAPTPFPDQSSATTVAPLTNTTLAPVNPELKKHCLQTRGQFPSASCKKFVNCWDGGVVEQECPEGLLFSTKGYCDYPHNVDCGTRGSSKVVFSESTECPQESGTFREANDCGSYYTCVFNKIVARYACPIGFKFSERLGVCNHENIVDCSEKAFSYEKMEYITSNKNNEDHTEHLLQDTACSVEYGTFRDRNNCSIYYTCSSYKIVAKRECPPGYTFNDDIGICDDSYKVDCTRPSKIYQITKNSILQIPQEYRETVRNCKPGSVIRLNSECTAACLCRNGLAEVVQCPEGFAYDSPIDKCVAAHLARC